MLYVADQLLNRRVGKAKRAHRNSTPVRVLVLIRDGPLMPNYRRANLAGGTYFFTVTLADRSSSLLIDEIDRLRRVYRRVQDRQGFETIAICVLPDHIHAIWTLPAHDRDFASSWGLIKSGFSRGLDA